MRMGSSYRGGLASFAVIPTLFIALAALGATPVGGPSGAPAVAQDGPSILQTYKGHFLIGTAGDPPGGFSEQELRLIKENFNVITPENYLKPAPVHPLEDVWSFKRPDALVDWCAQNNIAVHGHTLLWHSQTNNWFFEGNDKEATIRRMREHITTLVGHYKGKIRSWDVVNEAINDGGGNGQTENLRSSRWLQIVGPEFLTLAFKFAHEADPNALLFYNDYNIENGTKHQSSMVLLKRLIQEGAPINGVGIQGHWSTNGLPYASLDQAIADYASLGLKVAISELDITIAGSVGGQLNAGGGAPPGARRGRGTTGPANAIARGGFGNRGNRGARGGATADAAADNPASSVQAAVTDLSDEQKTRLAAVSDAAGVKLAQWQKTSQAALLAVQPQYTPGQVAYQHEFEEYTAEQAKQSALRDDIVNETEASIFTILSPAQAQKWQTAQLSAQATAQFGSIELTEAQKNRVTVLVADQATKPVAPDKAAVADAKAQFSKALLGVLDDAQLQQYQASTTPIASGRGAGRGGGAPPSPSGLKAQADAYARVFAILEKHKGTVDRVTFWGLNDARSWRTGQNPLLFDANNLRKPAYNAIVDVLLHPDPTLLSPP